MSRMLPQPRYTRKVDAFTATGTFTPPAGCTYAIAHILAGGGGVGISGSPGTGGTSSVAFASGTISATGGAPMNIIVSGSSGSNKTAVAGTVNSGNGAVFFNTSFDSGTSSVSAGGTASGQNGAEVVVGGVVTVGTGITVTVGAGGASGSSGASGGSGYVWIEYDCLA